MAMPAGSPSKREEGNSPPAGGEPGSASGHAAFTLVLGGGGARGFAHAGVLQGLAASGYRPSALVGVSMGAVVAATYALNDDWYRALRDAAADGLPAVPSYVRGADDGIRGARAVLSLGRLLRDLTLHWGTAERAQEDARRMVRELTCGGLLEAGRVPVAICTTDLRAGKRVVLRTGPAADAAFASAALAGVVPPLRRGGHLLVDGAYTDVAPVDVARSFGHPLVIAVDVRQPSATADPRNGLQALVRAMEICYARHAELRFAEADMVLRPAFGRTIDTLDFGAGRECMAAGLRAVRAQRGRLEHALGTSSLTCTGSAQPAPAL